MFFSICLRVVRMSLLGSVDRWVSPSHIKANDRLKLREESPVTAGGAATILTQGLILLGVCSCVRVCARAHVWEREQDKKWCTAAGICSGCSMSVILNTHLLPFSNSFQCQIFATIYIWEVPLFSQCDGLHSLFKRVGVSSQQVKLLNQAPIYHIVDNLAFVVFLLRFAWKNGSSNKPWIQGLSLEQTIYFISH